MSVLVKPTSIGRDNKEGIHLLLDALIDRLPDANLNLVAMVHITFEVLLELVLFELLLMLSKLTLHLNL